MASLKALKFRKLLNRTTSEAKLTSNSESKNRSSVASPNVKGDSLASENSSQLSASQRVSVTERLEGPVVDSGNCRPQEENLQLSKIHVIASGGTDTASTPNPDFYSTIQTHDSLFLWEEAYMNIRKAKPDLTAWYEELLARYLTTTSSDNLFPFALELQSSQSGSLNSEGLQTYRGNMKKILDRFLLLEDIDDRIGAEFQDLGTYRTFQDFLWRIAPAAQSSSSAIMVWVCIILAFKAVSIIPLHLEVCSSSLGRVLSSLNWFDGLSKLLLVQNHGDKEAPNPLSSIGINETLKQALIDLYMTILEQLIQLTSDATLEGKSLQWVEHSFQKEISEKERAIADAFDSYEVGKQFNMFMAITKQKAQATQDSGLATGRASPSVVGRSPTPEKSVDMPSPYHSILQLENEYDEDKATIQNAAYEWVSTTSQYQKFRNWKVDHSQMLWLTGASGTGKSLLLASILRNMSKDNQKSTGSGIPAYYMPRNNDLELRTSSSVVLSLVWQVTKSQPSLVEHWSTAITSIGRKQLDRSIDFYAVSSILYAMLQDERFEPSYFVIDAIDEICINGSLADAEQGLNDLIDLVFTTSRISSKLRWLISLDDHSFDVAVNTRSNDLRFSRVDLNSGRDSFYPIVRNYASSKVKHLLKETRGNEKFGVEVTQKLQNISQGNFLWVLVAARIIEVTESPWRALEILDTLPPGLDDLYRHAAGIIRTLPEIDCRYCHDVLYEVSCAYRPLRLSELEDITNVPSNVNLRLIIKKCSAFLSLEDGVVFCLHHSARIFLSYDKGLQQRGHARLTRNCLKFFNSRFPMDRDESPTAVGYKNISSGVKDEETIHYATQYWIKHLSEASEDPKIFDTDEEHPNLLPVIRDFFEAHFLTWLETLKTPLGLSYLIRQIADLEVLFSTQLQHAKNAQSCLPLLRHASQFLRLHQTTKSPVPGPKITNTLFFGPGNGSLRRELLNREYPWLTSMPHGDHGDSLSLEVHTDWVRYCAYSSNGRLVASCSDDSTVRIWDAQSGERQKTLQGLNDWVYKVLLSTSGLLITMLTTHIKIWDSSTFELIRELRASDALENSSLDDLIDMAFVSKSEQLAIAVGIRVGIWDTEFHKPQSAWNLDSKPNLKIRRLAGSSRGLLAVSTKFEDDSGEHNQIVVRNCEDPEKIHEIGTFAFEIDGLCFSPDGKWLASGSDDGNVRVWASDSLETPARIFPGHQFATNVSFSYDNSRVAASYHDRRIAIWNLEDSANEEPERVLSGHRGRITSLHFSPKDHSLASSSSDWTVRIWDTRTQPAANEIDTVALYAFDRKNMQSISIVAVSPDGRLVASGDVDSVICIWDGGTGRHIHTVKGHEGLVLSMCFSANGQRLVSTSSDGVVRVWDAKTNRQTHSFSGHSDWVRGAAFSPDGLMIASASDDRTIQLWKLTDTNPDKDNGRPSVTESRKLEGHNDYVRCVAFSPDGRTLASGGDNDSLLLWDLTSEPNILASETVTEPTSESLSFIKSCKTPGDVYGVMFYSYNGYERIVCSTAGRTYKMTVWDVRNMELLQTIDTPVLFKSLRYDPRHPSWALTEYGAWPLGRDATRPAAPAPPPWSPWRIDYEKRCWITWMDKETIFIPERYRPGETGFAVLEDRVVIGSAFGGILLFKFARDALPVPDQFLKARTLSWSTESNSQD